jgi:hypothetical protein
MQMSTERPSNPDSAIAGEPDELTASELDAVSGGDATNLSPDSLLTYTASRLKGLDDQVKQELGKQNGQGAHGHDRMTPFLRTK